MTATFELRGAESWRNPFDSYAELRATDPVHAVESTDYPTYWVLSRFDDVFAAVRDWETYSSAQGLTPDPHGMSLFEDGVLPIVMMDPPDHTEMRLLVNRPMTSHNVTSMEQPITAFVDRLLDRIAGQAAAGVAVDIVESRFKPLPSWIVAHYLGVPEADRDRFDGWTDSIVAANAGGDVAAAGRGALDLFEFATELIEYRRTNPGEDLVSDLVGSGDERASVQWILGLIFTMITGGNDTTTGLLGGSAELLTTRRDERQILLDDPTLIRPAVDEFLRLTSPVQNLARTTTRDVEVRGVGIASGSKVMLAYASANRDEREFGPSAGDLDVRRDFKRMLSLGYGPHLCLGASIARLSGGIALERLLTRFPDFTVDADAGRFAPGPYVRRYESLPFSTG
ncbi:MAG: cytochrome P450 [Acidimicrobiia bacterium]|nr:cytochrome P450 [Acidimicrobiia bacterium]